MMKFDVLRTDVQRVRNRGTHELKAPTKRAYLCAHLISHLYMLVPLSRPH